MNPEANGGNPLAGRIGSLCCPCGPDQSRRGFLTGLAALGTAAVLPGCAAPAAPAVLGRRDRIDTHHHYFAPGVLAEMKAHKVAFGPALTWSLARTIDDMDRAGTATAVMSATTPLVDFTDAAQGKKLARENNEYAARLMADHKGRFGSFAMLPMFNVEDALREIEYGLDVLKADGIGLMTSYGDKWLGHPSFAPVMDELNRRRAVVFVHPTAANCCHNLIPDTPTTVVEYGTDTTRTIVNLIFSGTAARCPDIRFIFSHSGGTIPFLVERLEHMPILNPSLKARIPNGVMHELRRFHYDTAWSANAYALDPLLKMVPKEQIVFGSDYPYRTSEDNIKGLIAYGFSAGDLDTITRGNALRLLPQLKRA